MYWIDLEFICQIKLRVFFLNGTIKLIKIMVAKYSQHFKNISWNIILNLDNSLYFYPFVYSENSLHFYCFIQNVSTNDSFGLLHVFHVELENLLGKSNPLFNPLE